MSQPPTTDVPQPVALAPRTTPFHWLEGKEGFVWLLSTGLLLLTGVLKGINLVIVLAYLLLALWALNLVLARYPIRRLRAERSALPTLIAGQTAEWFLTIHNAEPTRGYWMLDEHAGPADATWLVPPELPAVQVRMVATYPRRGRYPLAPLQASCGYPFGLCRRTVALLPAAEFIVQPQPARVDVEMLQAWLGRRQLVREEERRRLRRTVDREAELHGLRDYRPGDPMRRVHWKATARRGKLTVREYEDSIPPRLTLFLELWLPDAPDDTARQRLEEAISLAAGIVREWRRESGARLTLAGAAAEAFVLDGPPGSTVTTHMLEILAVAQGTSTPTFDLTRLSRPALMAPVLLLSTRPQSPHVRTLIEAVKHPIAIVDFTRPEPWYRLPAS
jgi:uncharacterized protein (DUF58 family)